MQGDQEVGAAQADGRTTWRLVLGAGGGEGEPEGAVVAADGATNMAVDHALLESVKAGGPPVLRLYRWDPATLSFGRNQPARGLYDDDAARARGIAFVRRPTGGQAVLHDDELTYAVVAPVGVVGRPREAYRRINQALVAGLREMGLSASLASAGRAAASGGPLPSPGGRIDWTAACFRAPAEGEVVAAGRKLVGSAQRTESRVILQHGSILIGGSQAVAEELLLDSAPAGGVAASQAGWTTLVAELGRRPDPDGLLGAVLSGFGSVFGTGLAPRTLTPAEAASARSLATRYASTGWTWRR